MVSNWIRTPLDSAWNYSLYDDAKSPPRENRATYLFMRKEYDPSGNLVRITKLDPDGETLYDRRVVVEGGKRVQDEEYFAESGSRVVHLYSRSGDEEREEILYDGELDSSALRQWDSSGRLRSEKKYDLDGNLVDLSEWDEKGRLVRSMAGSLEQSYEYGEADEPLRVVTKDEIGEIVEEARLEGGVVIGGVIYEDGEEIGRKKIERSGDSVTMTETRHGEVSAVRSETVDPAGRLTHLIESITRDDNSILDTELSQTWLSSGKIGRRNMVRRLRGSAGGNIIPLANGFRETEWDDSGRPVAILVASYKDEELEDDSLYVVTYE
jgi:hypothetical protein